MHSVSYRSYNGPGIWLFWIQFNQSCQKLFSTAGLHREAITVNACKQLESRKIVVRGAVETFKEQKTQLEFQLRDKNLTWTTWALTSLPALLFSCKPVYLYYMDSSPFQDRKPVFTYTEGNQQEEYNGSPHLQGSPCRDASLPRSNSFLYHFQIHYNIPI